MYNFSLFVTGDSRERIIDQTLPETWSRFFHLHERGHETVRRETVWHSEGLSWVRHLQRSSHPGTIFDTKYHSNDLLFVVILLQHDRPYPGIVNTLSAITAWFNASKHRPVAPSAETRSMSVPKTLGSIELSTFLWILRSLKRRKANGASQSSSALLGLPIIKRMKCILMLLRL